MKPTNSNSGPGSRYSARISEWCGDCKVPVQCDDAQSSYGSSDA